MCWGGGVFSPFPQPVELRISQNTVCVCCYAESRQNPTNTNQPEPHARNQNDTNGFKHHVKHKLVHATAVLRGLAEASVPTQTSKDPIPTIKTPALISSINDNTVVLNNTSGVLQDSPKKPYQHGPARTTCPKSVPGMIFSDVLQGRAKAAQTAVPTQTSQHPMPKIHLPGMIFSDHSKQFCFTRGRFSARTRHSSSSSCANTNQSAPHAQNQNARNEFSPITYNLLLCPRLRWSHLRSRTNTNQHPSQNTVLLHASLLFCRVSPKQPRQHKPASTLCPISKLHEQFQESFKTHSRRTRVCYSAKPTR